MEQEVVSVKVEAKNQAKSSRKKKGTKKTNSPKLRVVSTEEAQEREAQIESLILDHRENGRKLARSILRKWRVRMSGDEIDSIVDLALCEAAKRYSPERGASFMTFYFYHLRGHLVRSVARAAQASNVFLAFGQSAGTDTSEWRYVSSEALWGNAPEHLVFGQTDIETPENAVLRKEKIEECRQAVRQLDDLEKEIILRSFGGEQALVDIAKTLGYSRCHISRVKKSALSRLKNIIGEQTAPEQVENTKPLERKRGSAGRRTKRRSRRRVINSETGSAKTKAA
jgi:RNA polymerase sigma factor (sigma-70 family)